MHIAGQDFGTGRANDLSLGGWRPLFEATAEGADRIGAGLAGELAAELDALEAGWPAECGRPAHRRHPRRPFSRQRLFPR